MKLEATPWDAWLRAAFACGLPPEMFWRLSVLEWRALTASGDAAFDRAAFDALATRFPDQT